MSSKRFTTAVFIVTLLFAVTLRSEDAPCGICGTWTLIDRTDTTTDGRVIPEPNLGSNPLGILSYDAAGNVSVQLMKRDRTGSSTVSGAPQTQPSNNSAAVGGYDAYFGKYRLDRQDGTVTHTIQGALQVGDVGKSLTRAYALRGDELRLSFDTENSGVKVRRTLRWRRAA